MNIQQLEYILAVDTYRHFAKAAEHCRVTQPTLSMMIQKLEDELGVKLFDRNIQPVCPTPAGRKVIDQARVVLYQTSLIKDIVNEEEQSLKGTFRLICFPSFSSKYRKSILIWISAFWKCKRLLQRKPSLTAK